MYRVVQCEFMYRVSHFWWYCWVSQLLGKLELCGFREPWLLFCETKDAANKIVIALLFSELQGDIENCAFSGTPCISVVWQLVEKVKTNPFKHFHIESSGVVIFSAKFILQDINQTCSFLNGTPCIFLLNLFCLILLFSKIYNTYILKVDFRHFP